MRIEHAAEVGRLEEAESLGKLVVDGRHLFSVDRSIFTAFIDDDGFASVIGGQYGMQGRAKTPVLDICVLDGRAVPAASQPPRPVAAQENERDKEDAENAERHEGHDHRGTTGRIEPLEHGLRNVWVSQRGKEQPRWIEKGYHRKSARGC
jgi:hypothetical protein